MIILKISDFPKDIIKKNVKETVEGIEHIIKTCGPRESGCEGCFKSQEEIVKFLGDAVDETHYEGYTVAPKAFFSFTKVVSIAVMAAGIVSFALFFANIITYLTLNIIFGAVVGVGLFITVMEFLLYKQFCDPFCKKVEGHNLVATRKASGETKRRIIISGHCDSVYEWRHMYYFGGKGQAAVLASVIAGAIASFVVAIIQIILLAKGVDNGFADFVRIASYVLFPFTTVAMIGLFTFVDYKNLVPGANDNLTGTFAAACAVKMLHEADIRFENTEVVCMVTDGEEAGLRGCKKFAKDHYDDYMNSGVETAVLCVDTLTDLEFLNVYNRDMTGTVRHNPKFSSLVMEAAKDAGHNNLKFANVYFGSSDASAFTQAGIPATCLAAMDPTPADYYHIRRDIYDRLVPKAIETGYEIVLSSIFRFDQKGLS